MDRLADLAIKCAKERDAWKAKHDEQVYANTEAERLNKLKTEELEARLRKSAQEIGGLTAQLNQKTNEAASWKSRFDEQVQITADNERLFKSKVAELEQKITRMNEENKTLTSQLNEKTRESASWKAKFEDKVKQSEEYERNTKAKIAELENNLCKMVEKNNSLTNQLVEKTKESASWRAKFDEQVKANTENLRINKMKLSELESRIMNMTKDNQILAAQVAQKVEELTIWKLKFNEMELQAREFAAINQTLTQSLAESAEYLERTKRENRQLQLFIEEKYTEIQLLKGALADANEKIEYLDNEKLSLTILLNDQLAQMKELQAAFHEQNPGADHSKCCGQYKKIRAENNQKIKEDNEKKVRLARIDDTEKKLLKLLEQKKKLTQENERLEGNLMDKQKGLRDSYLSSGSPTNNAKSPMSRSPRKLGSKTPMSNMKESQGFSGFSAMVENMGNIDEEKPTKSPQSPKKRQADSLTPSKSKESFGSLTPKSASIKPRNIYRMTVNDEKVDTRPQTTVPGDIPESELQAITQERDRLLELLKDKNREIENLKTQLVEAKFYEEQYEAMIREKESMSTVLSEKIENVEEMAFRLKEVEGELSQVVLQAKATLLASENQKLNADLNKKINNIEEWKSKLGVLESLTSLGRKPQSDTKKQQNDDNKVENKLKTSLVVSRIGNESEESANSDAVTQGSPTIEAAPMSFRLKLQS